MNKAITLIACLSAAYTLMAVELTPQQAYSRAVDITAQTNITATQTTGQPELLYTVADTFTGSATAYILAESGKPGFIVVSADDIAVPLLGYSSESGFDAENMPPSMKAWLDGYAREIAAAKARHESDSPRVTSTTPDHAYIAPMVTTRWNQNSPYNHLCPTLNNLRSVTGCMATAEAQVLNYHKYPEKGTGNVSYKWKNGNRDIKADLDTIPLKWDLMLDIYSDKSPAESCQAVANLMYACGIVSNMDYSPSSSGANTINSAQGLYKYMGCKEASIVLRDWYNPDDWDNLVYNYLVDHGPLLYCGQSGAGGHAFVCDGYAGNGYYHFNWGWGGMSDGNFRLSALNPNSQGIGGSASGYNTSQQVITGLYKPGEQNKFIPTVAADGGITISSEFDGELGDTILVESDTETGGFYNFSMDNITVTYGLRITRNITNEDTFAPCYGITNRNLQGMRGWRNYPVEIPENLPDGTYTLAPAFNANGTGWHDMPIAQGQAKYVLMTVKENKTTFERPQPAPIKISNITLETPLYGGGAFKIKASATGTGDRKFYGNIAMLLGDFYDGEFVSDFQASPELISAKPGTDTEFTYTATLTNKRLKGQYKLVFVNTDNYKLASDPITVNVTEYVEPKISISETAIINASCVDPNDVKVKCNITCTQGFFSSTITLALGKIEDDNSFSIISRFESGVPYIESGNSETITFGGGFAGEQGKSYVARLEIYNASTRKFEPLSDFMTFTVGGTSAIYTPQADITAKIYPNPAASTATITAGAKITSLKVYSVNGTLTNVEADITNNIAVIDVTPLSSGLYLLQLHTTEGTSTLKLIKH